MDRRQMVAQRAREFFGDRIEDVVHMVRQDRNDLRGWEEPAHLRSVIRTAIREGGSERTTTETALAELEFGRGAAEPDKGQQREAMGQLLEVGAYALEKVARNQVHEMSLEDLLSLECVCLLYGRPAIVNNQNRLGSVPSFWNLLEDQREDIEMAQRGVGRIELYGHPDYDWAGTGFLVNENCLMTTRRTAELFLEHRGGNWQFRPGITAWMEYRSLAQGLPSAGYRVRGVFGVHEAYDLALLEVESPQHNAAMAPTPLALACQPPWQLENRLVYMVSFPVRDARRNEPESLTRIFRDVYGVKRIMPGAIRGTIQFRDITLLQHDCSMLGQNWGGAILDLETHQVLGLHTSSRYLEMGTAIPLWTLRDDPLFQRAGVCFSQAMGRELEFTLNQLERLARTRYWNEARAYIASLYQRSFGNSGNSSNGGTNPSFPNPAHFNNPNFGFNR